MSVSTQWTVDSICFQVAQLDAISQQEVFERIEKLKKEKQSAQERKRVFEELCKPWREDERSTEEIIRDIYESRTIGVNVLPRRRSFEELCGVWGNEEDREDVDRMVAAIHESRLLETKREPL